MRLRALVLVGAVGCGGERVVFWEVRDADGNVGLGTGGDGCSARSELDLFGSFTVEVGGDTLVEEDCSQGLTVKGDKVDGTLVLDYQDTAPLQVTDVTTRDLVFEAERIQAVTVSLNFQGPPEEVRLELHRVGDPDCTLPFDGDDVWFTPGTATSVANCEPQPLADGFGEFVAAVPYGEEWVLVAEGLRGGEVCDRNQARLSGLILDVTLGFGDPCAP